jgi:hypothetical protein
VIEPTSDDHQQDLIDHLRTQNRKYRELIQNLSSVVEIIRSRLGDLQPPTSCIQAFEDFDGDREIPIITPSPPSAAKRILRRVFRQSRKANPAEIRPLVPRPGWKCLAVDEPRIRIGFTLFGMTAGVVEKAVDEVERRQVRTRDFTPVFVTDCPNLKPFRIRGYVVEYIPASITSRALKKPDRRRYLTKRIEFISSKWGLERIVDLRHAHQ